MQFTIKKTMKEKTNMNMKMDDGRTTHSIHGEWNYESEHEDEYENG